MYFKKIYIIIVSLFILLVALNSISIIHAREIDSKFMNFLLSEDEVTSLILQKQLPDSWYVSTDTLVESVYQTWVSNDETIKIIIEFVILDSEERAIREMNYHTRTTSVCWDWGSFDGGILGDHSWISISSPDSASIITAYRNIGVLISALKGYDKNITLQLASAQMEKIDQNLSQEIIDYRQDLRQSRISAADYDQCMAEAVNVNLSGYTKITDGDSLWLMKDSGLKMGLRREWQNGEDRVIGIDICEVGSTAMASEIASERAKMSNGSVVNQLGSIPWQNSRSSQVLVKGNVAIHLYYLNHKASTSEPETSPPYFDPLLPYVPMSYLYPFPYSVDYSRLPYSSGFYSPFNYSASPYTHTPLLYPYAASIYNPEPPLWGGSAPFDYSLLNRYNTAAYPYTTNYLEPWRYNSSVNSVPNYYSGMYPYNPPYYLEPWRYNPFANSIPNYYSGIYPYNPPYSFLRKW